MLTDRRLPDEALGFIQKSIRERKVYWTYHVNMRLSGRHISRDELFGAVDRYEVTELHTDDKYLPSHLVLATPPGAVFHVLFAVDVDAGNVGVVTAYRPNPDDWESDLKTRRGQT